MDRSKTDCADQGHTASGEAAGPEASSRALVAPSSAGAGPRLRGGRPMANFLTQLIVSADPALRPARLERTKAAAALYARAAASR
ncbi:hypothetical protein C0214_18975 [Methylobacterium sp. DM1]|uniref:Uncharacterized protein n=1 Tax=Methylorubrum aminovorans TaxID=269069 RepID=A0ABQ4UIU5_9HYPH|nr:hypothetical protein [Methylorubrum aminovorans]AWI90158.1 hypothetical protein C0214_18975 [Methylobacterium sp. DM1]GJE66503.1 hypothetical protein LNAOJCKE_3723 [Methylorubrum aminovorans]GMA74151.1 hypothetical protein GCM10025880_05680 [Methylorubrum aminovorans]